MGYEGPLALGNCNCKTLVYYEKRTRKEDTSSETIALS